MRHNQNNRDNLNQIVLIQSNIGIYNDARLLVVEILNHALANEAILTFKTLSADRNIIGASFFALHDLFDSQYKQLIDISNKIAEGAQMLGGITIGTLQEIIDSTRLEEQPGIVPNVSNLLADHENIICFLHEDARKCSEEYQDDSTSELLMSVMLLHEKMARMLRFVLEPGVSKEESINLELKVSPLRTLFAPKKYEIIFSGTQERNKQQESKQAI